MSCQQNKQSQTNASTVKKANTLGLKLPAWLAGSRERADNTTKGAILMLTLVFTSIFVVVGASLAGLAVTQNKLGVQKIAWQEALNIAEAGVEYYRWLLAHDPYEYTNGTGEPGPYARTVPDPLGDDIGDASLVITPQIACTYTQTALPITVEAESMTPVSCECQILPGPPVHGKMKKNTDTHAKLTKSGISISATDNYTFEVTAKGDFAEGAWPIAEFIINDTQTVAVITINSSSWQVYSFTAPLTAGTVNYTIKHVNAIGSGLRALYIDKTDMTPANLPGTTVNESSVITLRSTGSTYTHASTIRTVEAIYGKKSLADFAFLSNSGIWFDSSESLNGPVHSNSGIRMDGTHNSTVDSAVATYLCNLSHGCNPSQTKNGVWGNGGTPSLWRFPTSNIDFNQLTVDLANLKSFATSSGVYLPDSGLGYHVSFQSDGTFDLYQVDTLTSPVWGWDGTEWRNESHSIATESFIDNYTIPTNCRVIFVEDHVWVDGTVQGRTTLVSAALPDIPGTNTRIVINGDITYTAKDGTDSLGIIAQKDILIPLYSPDSLEINAAMIAQKGRIMRYYYTADYAPFHLRSDVEVYGSIITNTPWTFSWVDEFGTVVSGYQMTATNYDPNLTFNPPPGFPTTGEFKLINWEEVTQ